MGCFERGTELQAIRTTDRDGALRHVGRLDMVVDESLNGMLVLGFEREMKSWYEDEGRV